MPLKGDIIADISLLNLSHLISRIKADHELNAIFDGKVLENTAFIVKKDDIVIAPLASSNIPSDKQEAFKKALTRILVESQKVN